MVVTLQMLNQLLVSINDFHTNLTPKCCLRSLLRMVLNVVEEVQMPIAIELTEMTLERRLMNNVLDIVKNDGVGVRMTQRSVIVIMRHQMFAILMSRYLGLTTWTFQKLG